MGEGVLGAGFAFDIEVRRGAGAYIAGEETALINSLEGKRAEPRNKPPFPAQSGLFGKPTAVNNVETLLSVLEILRVGGPAFASVGTSDVDWHPAVLPVRLRGGARPLRVRLRRDAARRDRRRGRRGAAGGRCRRCCSAARQACFVGPSALDMPLTFEGGPRGRRDPRLRRGLVLDDTVAVPSLLRRITQFFRDESCGQCVPCRVGTVRQEELVARLAGGTPLGSVATELALLVRHRLGRPRRVDLRPRPDGAVRG